MSVKEAVELALITLASALILSYPDLDPVTVALMFIPSAGVALHELAHRHLAVKTGKANVRVRAHIPGILLGVFTTLRTGGELVFMLPAYTEWEEPTSPLDVILKETSEEEVARRREEAAETDAKISIAGSAVNGVIALASLATLLLIASLPGGLESFLAEAIEKGNFLRYIAPLLLLQTLTFNGMLALINLIPIPPLPLIGATDGFTFLASTLELSKLGKKRKTPWHLLALALAGATIFILLGILGVVTENILKTYESVLPPS